jgi:hypothetical protein
MIKMSRWNKKNRELPMFEIKGTEEFMMCGKFYDNTMVLPIKVERHVYNNGNHRNTIIFDVIDEEDRLRALGSLQKLRNAFREYDIIIIKKYEAS